jgi:tetratricopeptide (TPR) repeat protein
LKGKLPAETHFPRRLPLLAIAISTGFSLALSIAPAILLAIRPAMAQTSMSERLEAVKQAQQAVQTAPRDAKKRFDYAEALRLTGDTKTAAIEYLNVTSLDPAYYIAYHQLLKSKATPDQLDEAADRLAKLEEQEPKNLMLRVALSEVYEQKGDLYQAARALVDLQYSHSIPDKYLPKINARIHYLLVKAKDVQTVQTAEKTQQPASDEDIDAAPLPLPESTLTKDLSAKKLKDSQETEGYGHTRLLP